MSPPKKSKKCLFACCHNHSPTYLLARRVFACVWLAISRQVTLPFHGWLVFHSWQWVSPSKFGRFSRYPTKCTLSQFPKSFGSSQSLMLSLSQTYLKMLQRAGSSETRVAHGIGRRSFGQVLRATNRSPFPPIIMEVETHPKWKETNIGGTYFSLPWWEEG